MLTHARPPVTPGWAHTNFPHSGGYVSVQVYTPEPKRSWMPDAFLLLSFDNGNAVYFRAPEAVTLGRCVRHGLADLGVLLDWVREHTDLAQRNNGDPYPDAEAKLNEWIDQWHAAVNG